MKKPPTFHHFIVVPTKRPEQIQYFLQSYWEHAQRSRCAERVRFVVVNSSQTPAYHKLKRAIAEFQKMNPDADGRIHFINFEWRDRFLGELKKRKVPYELRRFMHDFSYAQLRNLGYFASLRLAKELRLRPERVLLHQIDDDVLPEYSLHRSPKERRPLPGSISLFRTAEDAFSNKRIVHALLGNYTGQPDMEVPDAINKALRSGKGYADEPSLHTKQGISEDLDRALDYYDSLLGGVDSELPKSWLQKPRAKDFSRIIHHEEYASRERALKKITALEAASIGRPGGALVFRLDWYGHVPLTAYRGEDHLHIGDRIKEDEEHAYIAPQRLLFHDKSPERDMLWDAQSDFKDSVLRMALLNPGVPLNPRLVEKNVKEIALKHLIDFPPSAPIQQAMDATGELIRETAGRINELKKEPKPKRDMRSLRRIREDLRKLEHMRDLQEMFQSKLASLRRFYFDGATKPEEHADMTAEIASFMKRRELFDRHKDSIIRAALEIPVPKCNGKKGNRN